LGLRETRKEKKVEDGDQAHHYGSTAQSSLTTLVSDKPSTTTEGIKSVPIPSTTAAIPTARPRSFSVLIIP
jgi:hypothetical protein